MARTPLLLFIRGDDFRLVEDERSTATPMALASRAKSLSTFASNHSKNAPVANQSVFDHLRDSTREFAIRKRL